MKCYFLTHKNMTNLNESNNLIQEAQETPDTNSTAKKLVNLATSVAITASLTLSTPANADTSNFNVATAVANGSIDNGSELSKIEHQIQNIENQIKTIETKNELTTDDKRTRYKLQKQKDVLEKQQLAIVDKENEKKRDNIKTKINEIKNLISSR